MEHIKLLLTIQILFHLSIVRSEDDEVRTIESMSKEVSLLRKNNSELEKSNLALLEWNADLEKTNWRFGISLTRLAKSLEECVLRFSDKSDPSRPSVTNGTSGSSATNGTSGSSGTSGSNGSSGSNEVVQKKVCINENNSNGCILPSSCAKLFLKKPKTKDGVYILDIGVNGIEPFEVYCMKDPVGGYGWTVIQRRMDGSEDFYRNWCDYQKGFGKLESEFWLGLDKLYAMTHPLPSELWILVRDVEGSQRFAKYDNFAIGSEGEKYVLKTLGNYKGDDSDELRYNQGHKFGTKDQKNDNSAHVCGQYKHSGWWFKSCSSSNLNGLYNGENKKATIKWSKWSVQALRYTHMAIRPKSGNC